MKGGYKIIDLRDTEFTSGTPVTINGIYKSVESTNKPTVLSKFYLSGKEYDSVFCFLVNQGTTFYGIMYYTDSTGSLKEISIKIKNDDTITLIEK